MKLNRLFLNVSTLLALSGATLGFAATGPTPTETKAAAPKVAPLLLADAHGAACRTLGSTPAFEGRPGVVAAHAIGGARLQDAALVERMGDHCVPRAAAQAGDVSEGW